MRKIFAVLLLGACALRPYEKGVPMRESQIADAFAAKNKAQVMAAVGSPAAVSFVGAERWFYAHADGRVVAFFAPTFKSYQVLSVKFDARDSVVETKIVDIKDADFAVLDRKTIIPTSIEPGFFDELFGHIGSVNMGNGGAAQ